MMTMASHRVLSAAWLRVAPSPPQRQGQAPRARASPLSCRVRGGTSRHHIRRDSVRYGTVAVTRGCPQVPRPPLARCHGPACTCWREAGWRPGCGQRSRWQRVGRRPWRPRATLRRGRGRRARVSQEAAEPGYCLSSCPAPGPRSNRVPMGRLTILGALRPRAEIEHLRSSYSVGRTGRRGTARAVPGSVLSIPDPRHSPWRNVGHRAQSCRAAARPRAGDPGVAAPGPPPGPPGADRAAAELTRAAWLPSAGAAVGRPEAASGIRRATPTTSRPGAIRRDRHSGVTRLTFSYLTRESRHE